MPIYEYRCSDCGHRLEALQRLADAPLLVCPACSKESLVKLISAVGFQLKGSGWYATDFKHSGSKPPDKGGAKSVEGTSESSSSGAKSEGETSTAPSAEQKSAAKTSSESAGTESKTTSAADKTTPAATPPKPAASGS